MYRRVSLKSWSDGYILSLTPTQFELVRRALVDLYGGSHSPEVLAVVAGDAPEGLLELRDREVDFQSRANIELTLSLPDLRVLYSSLAFAFLNHSSEEAFHHRYGFYSENMQAVGWAICEALQNQDADTRA